MVHYNITQKATQRRGLSVPNRGPSPQAASPFFPILLRDQNRGNATQQNAIGVPAVATVGLSLFQTTYCFTSPAICGDGFRCWKPTKLREGHEDQHCNTELGNKKNIRNSQQWQPICISVRGLLVFRSHCLPCLTSQILQSPF